MFQVVPIPKKQKPITESVEKPQLSKEELLKKNEGLRKLVKIKTD